MSRPPYPSPMSSAARPTFSIVIPSAGRPSLVRTVESLVGQVEPGDEIIVVVNDYRDGGNRGRQEGMAKASGSHILFCDDDDVFLPHALAAVRQFASEHPGRIGLFRRVFNPPGVIQWSDPVLRRGNLQAQCICVPNAPGRLGTWGENAEDPERLRQLDEEGVPRWTDVFFIQETSELLGTEPVWCDVAVGLARPERNPLRRLRYWLAPGYRLRQLLGGRSAGRPPWSDRVWRPDS
jgi:glycosyltransferase involved in cell wall biosynthesis